MSPARPTTDVAPAAPETHDDPPAKRGGPGGFLGGFAPWIVYWILSGNVPFSTAIGVAIALSVLLNVLALKRHEQLKVLEVGNTVAFIGLAIIGLAAGDAFVGRWIQPLGNASLLLIMLVSIFIKKPFTLQYARESVPEEMWDSPGFIAVNTLISWVWVGAMTVMTVLALIPPIVQGDATMNDGGAPLSIICYWVIPFTAMGLAILFTTKYPDWFGAEFEDAPAGASAPPVPPLPTSAPTDHPVEGSARLVLDPISTVLDEVPAISVIGAPGNADVTVTARTVDVVGQLWESSATFTADAAGTVDLAHATPTAGTYEGADASGLLWSMRFSSEGQVPDLYIPSWTPSGTSITAAIAGGPTLAATIARRAAGEGVSTTDVREGGVVGRLSLPPGSGPFPGVVLFGGSEGGIDSQGSNAAVLASRGFAAFAAGYFGVDGLPDGLVQIPLESLAASIRWLAAHPAVTGPVGAMAISRGAEGLLSTVARVPDLPVGAIVAVSPSDVAWQAIGDEGSIPDTASWTIAGDAVPWLAVRDDALMADAMRNALRDRGRKGPGHEHLMILTHAYSKSLEDKAGAATAAIPVEQIGAPILFVSGTDDQVWPSGRMADALLARRQDAGDRHQAYAGAGHLLRLGIMPTTVDATGGVAFGGTAPATAAAQADLTERVLAFFTQTLPSS